MISIISLIFALLDDFLSQGAITIASYVISKIVKREVKNYLFRVLVLIDPKSLPWEILY